MKPLSKGCGDESYTLYYPIVFPSKAEPANLGDLLAQISRVLPESIHLESLRKSHECTLKVSNFKSEIDAEIWYEKMSNIFTYLSILSDIDIQTYKLEPITTISGLGDNADEVVSKGWADAKKAGWSVDKKLDLYRIDGRANLSRAVIVPEHKNIVDIDVLVAYRRVSLITENIEDAINNGLNINLEKISENLSAAIQCYQNAFSQENLILRYISLVTCLEIISHRRPRDKDFIGVVKMVLSKRNSIEISNDAEKEALGKICSSIGQLKKQSISESVLDLVGNYSDAINNKIPPHSPFKDAVKNGARMVYDIRSELVHAGVLEKCNYENFFNALEFSHIVAKTILLIKVRAESGSVVEQ